jgi:periplasmic protein TonB
VTPKNCIGAGCEAEAIRLLEASPKWKPGLQNGIPVRVAYFIPISFSLGKEKVTYIGNLKKSDYGFVFNIKGTLYTIDEAEKIIGSSFMPYQIQSADPFYNYNKVPKFDMPNKKEVYILIFKSA